MRVKSASGSIFDVDRNRTSCYLVACQTTTKNHNGQITALFSIRFCLNGEAGGSRGVGRQGFGPLWETGYRAIGVYMYTFEGVQGEWKWGVKKVNG